MQFVRKKLFKSCLVFCLVLGAAQAMTQPVDFTQVVEKADPAVVNIRTVDRIEIKNNSNVPDALGFPFNIPGFPQLRPAPRKPVPKSDSPDQTEEAPRGIGSGFVISADGFILTNHHVVDGADEIYVTFLDKRELKAKVIGSDARTDVALIKVEASKLSKLAIGNPAALRKGEWVLAIGSPFGLESTVTAGIVSAKGRDTGDFVPFIQTDVSINPGNSGGPLLNTKGEVVGINSQIFSRSGGSVGVSFAIPIDEAIRVADQLKASGRVARGKIGVAIEPLTKELAEGLGLGKPNGALIGGVERGGPAEKAGIEAGDVILKFDGNSIEKSIELPRLAGAKKPGTSVVLSVWHQGKIKEVTLVLGEFSPAKTVSDASKKQDGEDKTKSSKPDPLGLTVSNLSEEQKSELKVRNGLKVDSVQGNAAKAGIKAGDVLLAISQGAAQISLSQVTQLNELLSKANTAKPLFLLIKRSDTVQWVSVRMTMP